MRRENLPGQRLARSVENRDRGPESGTAGNHYRVAVFGGVAQYVDTASAWTATARSPAWAASGGPTSSAQTVNAAMAAADRTGTTTVLFNIAVPRVEVKLDGESRAPLHSEQLSFTYISV